MDMDTLLWQLADRCTQESIGNRPEEFHRADDLVVAGSVTFTEPAPAEWSAFDGVPHGSHPVHIGVVRRRDADSGEESTYVTMVVIPLAAPEVIARATFADAIEDYQPLGPDLGFLWDSAAMDCLRFDGPRPEGFADLDAFVGHVESELATGKAAWLNVRLHPETGSNVLAFPVCAESAGGFEGRDGDGALVCLVLTADF